MDTSSRKQSMSQMDLKNRQESKVRDESSEYTSNTTLFGTLDIEGEGNYYVFLSQKRSMNTWMLTEKSIFDNNLQRDEKVERVVAILKSYTTGRLEGYGKTYLLTRLMSNISSLTYLCLYKNDIKNDFYRMRGEYSGTDGSYIRFVTSRHGGVYYELDMIYEGFRLTISPYNRDLPIRITKLYPVIDRDAKAAIVANLGVTTAASLFKSMGDRLDWYKHKKYKLVDSSETFQAMMLSFLRCVQQAHKENKTVVVGLDTETTGLNMLDLDPSNPLRDNVVSIPFAWKDNEAYVICTDMMYFSNVPSEEVYPLFSTLFRRNPDFSFQDIELDYCGEHFSFNRKNITVTGWNAFFDIKAFFSEGADVFFDEDGRQLYFNLDTDLQQGQAGMQQWGSFKISNALKMQTRRMIGDETLELDELFGKGNEDKYRYLQDVTLALLYGGADADYTRLTTRKGKSMLEPNLYKQYRKYDMTMIYMMAKASWKGMPIDTESVKRLGDLVYKDLETLKDFIYHYAWLANRDTLREKSDRLQELLGVDSLEEVEHVSQEDKMFRYVFTPANHKKLLFQMLGYPVYKINEKSGEPALDKFVLQKLMGVKRETPSNILLEDIMSQSDPTMKLIDKDEFNSDAYPLARVFSTYATLNKEYTSYYRPIVDNDTEGRMFYDFTLARAATRRILSPGQTMKGSLKKFVIAPPGKIFMSFDASQIEYRHMASLAYIRTKKQLQSKHPKDWEKRLAESSIATIFNMMQKEEADYHIETAASMTGVKQHEVTPKVRKRYKSIGFGIPYGLGERSMCESLHSGVVNEETLRETRELLRDYRKKQKEIIDLLEYSRDSAFIPVNISDEYRKYLGVGDSHVGIVRNFVGFYRLFILENLTVGRTGRIRRQAGNCIIQGGAAELFRRMLYNFHIGCCKAGIQDKVQWLMTVHDELDAIIDDDIDIMCLIKVLYENCTLRYEDHIPYYIGINFGANWYDAKADSNELPVIMVQRMIKAYDAGTFSIPSDGRQAENLLNLKRHYLCDRIEEELKAIIPNLGPGHVWTEKDVDLVDTKFENYVVRSYLEVFSHKGATLKEVLQDWQKAREDYGFGVGFLTENLAHNNNIDNIDLSDDDSSLEVSLDDAEGLDLTIDLLDDSDDLESAIQEESSWFGEMSLFDQSAQTSEILVDSGYTVYTSNGKEKVEDLVENPNPTTAFDVFLPKDYVRTKVLKMSSEMYSAMTANSSYNGQERLLGKIIKKHFSEGTGTILLVGTSMLKVSNVNLSEEDLTWLDKILTGVETFTG